MLNKVKDFIGRHSLLDKDELQLVAVSGGADSVAMALVLLQLGYRVEVVHCNFHLRGQESDRDESFVRSLCSSRHIPFHVAHFDTKTYASLHGVSIEMAARNLRYDYFERLRSDLGAESVCVAHHRDDSAETIVINLLRSTGLRGMTGIKPKSGHVVRPFLCLSRQEILQWLTGQGQEYVTDSSNLTADIWRNKVRLQVMPALMGITPHAVQGIVQSGDLMAETLKVYDKYMTSAVERLVGHGQSVSITQIMAEPSPLCFLHFWLSPYGFSTRVLQQIADSLGHCRTGKHWASATHELLCHRDRLILGRIEEPPASLVIPESGCYVISDKMRITLSEESLTSVSKLPDEVTLDCLKVKFPLTLRPVEEGDRFSPYGLKGTKLVSDFLTDLRKNHFERRCQLVLVDSKGTIIWVVGLRVASQVAIGPETSRVLRIRIQETA